MAAKAVFEAIILASETHY